jgi:nucleoside-diphosphate-sugar epimerase
MIDSEAQLDDRLTRPGEALVEFVRSLNGPLVILGAGGKMGPSLAVLAKRAALAAGNSLEVIAVSRFSDERARQWLEDRGVKTTSCDLIAEGSLDSLPDAGNVIYLVGLKFGTARDPAATWAINTIVPARVMERYPRARIAALSTGNVYPLSAVNRGGSVEGDPLTPLGEYANAAVARERIFQFYSARQSTPVALLRLYYAVELRYGVLVDIARKVAAGETIELANGSFNCIWQGDANELAIRSLSLAATPASAWNLCRPEIFSVRAVAGRFGELFGRPPVFSGTESDTALLGNATPLCTRLSAPAVPLDAMQEWIAHWIKLGGRDLSRPTHFEVRDGKY